VTAARCSARALCIARYGAWYNGWIERVDDDDTSRDRRTYRLTSRGRRNVEVEMERIRYLTKGALRLDRTEA
jgi:DNA-binding PadR family transcriptional regulator